MTEGSVIMAFRRIRDIEFQFFPRESIRLGLLAMAEMAYLQELQKVYLASK